jgi:hypothetical protein
MLSVPQAFLSLATLPPATPSGEECGFAAHAIPLRVSFPLRSLRETLSLSLV